MIFLKKMEKINKEKLYRQFYSFIKTYLTVFLALYLFGIDSQNREMFDLLFISEIAKYSLLSLIRNFYKLITENEQD